MQKLKAALTDAEASNGRAMAVEAGAGLGKTRILQEGRRLAKEAGLKVLFARATELERNFPFALLRQLFDPELAAFSSAEHQTIFEGAAAARRAFGFEADRASTEDSFAVLHALYWVTAALAERTPLMLAIDDAHWGDSGSLDYVNFLLPRLEELPVLLLITARPDEPVPPSSLERVLLDPHVQHLPLLPLSLEATTTLLAEELGRQPDLTFAATCHEVSGGNPFLLTELARTLLAQGIAPSLEQAELVREQVPEQATRMVLTRIQKLTSRAITVAQSLAVLGDGSDISLIASMSGGDTEETLEAVDELRASSILDGSSPPRFIHPLVRNAIYADLPIGQRSNAHTQAAGLLQRRGASAERVATQLLATEPQGERNTAEALLEAGRQALRSGAPRSAIAYLTRALQEPSPIDLQAAVLELLLLAISRAADLATFAAVEREIFEEWERNPSVRSRWAIHLTLLVASSGRLEDVGSLLREAIDAAISEGDVNRGYQLREQLSTLAAVVPSLAEEATLDDLPEVDPASPAGRLVAAMEARAAIVSGTAAEVIGAAQRALGDGGSIFTEEQELSAAVITVIILVAADEIESGRYGAERALAVARESGGTPALIRARFLSGLVAWGDGDLRGAETDMLQAVDLARQAGIIPLAMLGVGPIVEVLIERDELDEAEAQLRALGLSEGQFPVFSIAGMVLVNRGHLRFEKGDFEGAIEDLGPLWSESVKSKVGLGPAALGCVYAVRSLMALGRVDEARALADDVALWARHFDAPSILLHAERAVAASRKKQEGIEILEEAIAKAGGSARRVERAHALVDLGEALRQAGRRADARIPLREAFDLARRCGAARIAKRANAELQATGAKVRRYAPIGVESLTPSERRVADLAASGMTNRQIAQSLFVTVKTVEAHLSAAYGKLDIGSRGELPAALRSDAREPAG